MSNHSILAPSSMAQIVQCPASVAMQRPYPDAGGPEAQAGEASHWAGAEMLGGRLPDVGDTAPNGVRLDVEMLEGADEYYADIYHRLNELGLKTTDGAIEVSVECKRVHTECWGTPDFRIWARQPNGRLLLLLWDYKFGYRTVEVFQNWQLITYAVGCIDQASTTDQGVDVEMRIVQPRAHHRDGPVRVWRVEATDLRAHINIAHAACSEALTDAPRTKVGPECKYCTARHACPTLGAAAAGAADEAGRAQPLELKPHELGVELRYLKRAQALLDARVSGLQEQALSMAQQGQNVPHWSMQSGQGRLKWKAPQAEVIAVAQAMHLDVVKAPELITPTQAIAKGLPKEMVEMMAERPRGAAELVADDGSKARQVFGRKP